MARPKTLKTCTFCAKQVYKIAGHGLCAACYYREKRNGTPAYVKVRKPCSVEGCDSLSVAQDFCETHYRRWKRHGVAENERFDRWGHVTKHPLAQCYYWARKVDGIHFHQPWRDFWQFVADIGDRPSPDHKLRKDRQSAPLGPENFRWVPPKFETVWKDDTLAYARLTAASNPRGRKNAILKKVYGITIEQYDAMHAAQEGKCSICGDGERAVNTKTGLPRDLAVDHCHTAGKVRDLLCASCNGGLGNFRDDPALLRAALAYLERHIARA